MYLGTWYCDRHLSHLIFPTPIGSNYSHTRFADEEMEPQEAMEFSQTHPVYKCA